LEKIEEFCPRTAVLLNLSPDHLDRYRNYEEYKQAKLRIFENQQETDFAVLNADDPGLSDLPPKLAAKVAFFSTKAEVGLGACVRQGEICLKRNGHYDLVLPAIKVGIQGPHNLSNATAACAIGLSFGLAPEVMARALAEFKGVEHRLEFVAEIDGVKFINDSKATNVDAVWYALQSVPQPIILIAGGKDKGGSYAPLRELVAQRVKKLILIGQAKEKIKEALGDLVPTVTAGNLPEAVEVGFSSAAPGETVLLSPACASFDMFTNFEERGRVFKQAVAGLKGRTGGGNR
jgi:UDP-N-acetylmuramoylalanine--D-glutamate ligase